MLSYSRRYLGYLYGNTKDLWVIYRKRLNICLAGFSITGDVLFKCSTKISELNNRYMYLKYILCTLSLKKILSPLLNVVLTGNYQ